jgi:hypothetical protein
METQAKARPKKAGMNQTEAEYLAMLKADQSVTHVAYEAITLRIGEGCSYTPDFAVFRGRLLELHEVKGGHVWDDAKVKFKAAKEQYPGIRFVWAQKKEGKWEIK